MYLIMPNGMKVELSGFNPASSYAQEHLRNEIAAALQVPKDMLFPTEVLALTDKNKLEGSIEVNPCLNEQKT